MKRKLMLAIAFVLACVMAFASAGCNSVGSKLVSSPMVETSSVTELEQRNAPENAEMVYHMQLDETGAVKGIYGPGTPHCSITEYPTGKYLLTINLRPGILYRQYRRVLFSIYNNGTVTGWSVNIGDSSTNNGYAGDAGTQSNDAELQVLNGTMYMYASDYGSGQLLHQKSNVFPTTGSRNMRISVENGKASYWPNFDTAQTTTVTSPYLYALNGQADAEGPVNYTIYAAFNRVVSYHSDRVSSSVTDVYVYMEDEINGTPAYEPAYWNDAGTIQYNNNCYNYGCNKRTDTFAQPGEAHGVYLSIPLTATMLRNAAEADYLENGAYPGTPPVGKSIVALFYYNYDYHWYRLDRNGYWSHKPGGTQATNKDNSGNIITDPRTADRGYYTNFVDFFYVDSDYDQGEGHEVIQ